MFYTIKTIHFLKALGPRISKLILPSVSCANTQIHKYKYTNTQIQHMTKCQKDPTGGIFLKRGLFKDIKNYIPMCWTHDYKNTNTNYTNTAFAKVPERPKCGIFLKRWLFKDIKNYIPMCRTHKYQNTNTQIYKCSIWQSARKTQNVAYFWKEDCSRVSKIIFPYNTNLNIWVSHSYTRSS